MIAPDLPDQLKAHLASISMRDHHATWHFVRTKWNDISEQRRRELCNLGWKPPRLATQADSGIDFLGMHGRMVSEIRKYAADQGINADLSAWDPIPWAPDDPVWPMPPDYPPGSHSRWKRPDVTQKYHAEATETLLQPEWLKTVSLDSLGIRIEAGIHNWLHLHWSADPWYKGQPGQDINDIRNDWLADPYASHVNKHFWKLHGWIDDRVYSWGKANDAKPDLSEAWCGPPHHLLTVPALTPAEFRVASRIFFEGFEADTTKTRSAT
jgi:hypothetical protein